MFFSFQIIWMTYSIQRGKPCVEKTPWFITGGGTAGSHRLGTSLSQEEVSWASMGWEGGGLREVPDSQLPPCSGNHLLQPPQHLLSPRNTGISHPRWFSFFFLSPALLSAEPTQGSPLHCSLQEPDSPEFPWPVATQVFNSISYLFILPPLLFFWMNLICKAEIETRTREQTHGY